MESDANHSFVASKLVQEYHLTVNLNTSMMVMLADGSQVKICENCYVPIITCTMSNKPVSCVVQCRILPTLSHDLVLKFNWLQ